jgi:hypothetical protein
MKKLLALAVVLVLAVAGCKYCPFTGSDWDDAPASTTPPAAATAAASADMEK